MKSFCPSLAISAVFLMSAACPFSFAAQEIDNPTVQEGSGITLSSSEQPAPSATSTSSSWLPSIGNLMRSIATTVTMPFSSPPVDESFLTKDMDIRDKDNSSAHFLLGHHDAFSEDDINIMLYKGYKALNEIANGTDVTESNVWIFKKNGERFTGLLPYGILGNVIVYGENQDLEKAQKKIETFICIVWALCDYSFKQKKGFHRGSFSIIDTDGYFEQYLKNYMIFVGEATGEKLDGLSDLSTNVTSAAKFAGINNQAYRRNSSHFGNHELFYADAHYGCDARFLRSGYTLQVLPFSYTHILLSFVKNKLGAKKIFFKPEEYGVGDVVSLAQHGAYYANSGKAADREHPLMAREKYIPDDIAQATYDLLNVSTAAFYREENDAEPEDEEAEETDDADTENQRENSADASASSPSSTPFEEKYFLKCIENFHKKNKSVAFYNNSNNIDMSMLWAWCQWTGYEDDIQNKIDDLKATIIKNYGDDDNQLRHRTGHEVVLNISAFKEIIVDLETFFIQQATIDAIDTPSTPHDSDDDWDSMTVLA